jgi:hypothetical protein
VLEFVFLIINVWFCIWHTKTHEPDKPGGHIVLIRGDNTSALSWLRHSTRSCSPPVRRLSRLLVHLLTQSAFPGRIISNHIRGKDNDEADCLSRPLSRAPSWASVTTLCSQLKTCRKLAVPSSVLSSISLLLLPNGTEEASEQAMTQLSTAEPIIL